MDPLTRVRDRLHRILSGRTGQELDELRTRVRTAEAELATARQRARRAEAELAQLRDGEATPFADGARALDAEGTPLGTPYSTGTHPPTEANAPAEPAGDVVIDVRECIGCGTCASLAPSAFEMDDAEGLARVHTQGAPASEVQDAIDSCPTTCIRWKE